jgi:hypothetical protein
VSRALKGGNAVGRAAAGRACGRRPRDGPGHGSEIYESPLLQAQLVKADLITIGFIQDF